MRRLHLSSRTRCSPRKSRVNANTAAASREPNADPIATAKESTCCMAVKVAEGDVRHVEIRPSGNPVPKTSCSMPIKLPSSGAEMGMGPRTAKDKSVAPSPILLELRRLSSPTPRTEPYDERTDACPCSTPAFLLLDQTWEAPDIGMRDECSAA